MRQQCWWVLALAMAVGVLIPDIGRAGPIEPGWDLLTTTSGTTFGGVAFQGVPLGTFNFGGTIGTQGTGNADTIVKRLAPASPLPVDPATIPVELVALQLQSVIPVDMGAGLGTYYISLQSARGGPVSSGQQSIHFDTPSSGTFDSFFDVFFDLRFGSLSGPIVLSDQLRLESHNTQWSTTAPPNAVLIDGVNHLLNGQNTDGDFWPGPIQERHPSGAQHNVTAATPEPASLSLLGIGIAGLTGYGWRRRKLALAV